MSRLHSAAEPAGFDHSLQSHTTFQFIIHDHASLGSFWDLEFRFLCYSAFLSNRVFSVFRTKALNEFVCLSH
jgi:hypothetical protein